MSAGVESLMVIDGHVFNISDHDMDMIIERAENVLFAQPPKNVPRDDLIAVIKMLAAGVLELDWRRKLN
jgi:hypothetical protein